MNSNLVRFWKFQLSRITANKDSPEPAPFYPRNTAPLLFRSARSCITDASDSNNKYKSSQRVHAAFMPPTTQFCCGHTRL